MNLESMLDDTKVGDKKARKVFHNFLKQYVVSIHTDEGSENSNNLVRIMSLTEQLPSRPGPNNPNNPNNSEQKEEETTSLSNLFS